jgi:hypothetical protein
LKTSASRKYVTDDVLDDVTDDDFVNGKRTLKNFFYFLCVLVRSIDVYRNLRGHEQKKQQKMMLEDDATEGAREIDPNTRYM